MKEQLLKLQEVFTKAKGISVELKDVNTIENLIKEGLKLNNKAEKATKKYSKKIKELKESRKELDFVVTHLKSFANSELPKNLNALRQSAKNLGIKVEDIDIYKEGRKLREQIQTVLKELDDLLILRV